MGKGYPVCQKSVRDMCMFVHDSAMAEAKLQCDGWTKKTIPRASAVSVSIGSIARLDSWDVLTIFHRNDRKASSNGCHLGGMMRTNMSDQKQIDLGLYFYTNDPLTPTPGLHRF